MLTLNQFKINQEGEIARVVEHELKAKLTDMGLYPGKQIKLLFRAPFGDPIAIDVEGYVLSLRLEEAALIKVTTFK